MVKSSEFLTNYRI